MKRAAIVVRMLPPREVSPNYHGPWQKRANGVRNLRNMAQWAARLTPQAQWFAGETSPVLMDFEIAWCCGRKRMDDGNAKGAMKAIIDGIADELWQGQDGHVVVGEMRQTRGDGEVTVTLQSVYASQDANNGVRRGEADRQGV